MVWLKILILKNLLVIKMYFLKLIFAIETRYTFILIAELNKTIFHETRVFLNVLRLSFCRVKLIFDVQRNCNTWKYQYNAFSQI